MRLSGDVEDCRDAVRVLERCAAAVRAAQERADLHPIGPTVWDGLAADVFRGERQIAAADVDDTARLVATAGSALRVFAEGLAELQERARQLADQAAGSRLVLDDDGGIAPVLAGTDPELRQEQLRRSAVRTAVLQGVRSLQDEEDALHARLVRALGQEVATPAEQRSEDGSDRWSSPWLPGAGDAPAAVLAGASAGLAAVADDGLRLVGRAAGSTPVGAVVTAGGELASGADLGDAAATTVVVTAGAQAGGVLAFTGLTVVAAPVVVPAAAAVAVVALGGLAGGYVADRLWDAHGHHVQRAGGRLLSSARGWVDRPSDGRRRRR